MAEKVEQMSTGGDHTHDNNVLSLDARPKRYQQIDQIEGYWNKVRGNRLVPSRCEIDPRGLNGVLSNAFILERIAGGLARFRIAGSHLCEISGLELRQMPLSALFVPDSRNILSEAMEAVFDEPAVVRMQVISPSGFGREKMVGELILMPLRSDLGDVDRILGGLVFEGKVGRTPRRIEIVDQSRQSLTGYAGDTPVSTPISNSLNDYKEKPFKPADSTIVKPAKTERVIERKHLRLVVSND